MSAHLQLIASQPAPRTWGEGMIAGYADGYEQGRRDRGMELALIGYFAGLITLALFLLLFK